MSDTSFGAYATKTDDHAFIRDLVTDLLRRQRYKVRKTGGGERRFKIEAVRGHSILAVVAAFVPGLDILYGRTKTTIACSESLNDGEHDLRLTVRCDALRELTDEKETFIGTQGLGEYLSDNVRTRRAFRAIVRFLRDNDVIAGHDGP